MAFRLSSKNLFITYPQAPNLTKEIILQKLQSLGTLTNYIIGQELHQDLGTHFHCCLTYNSPITTRNARLFDIQNYHPNVQSTRNVPQSANYCRKDGNFIESSDVYGVARRERGPGLADLLRESNSRDEYLNLVLQSNDTANRFSAAERIATFKFPDQLILPYISDFPPASFRVPLEVLTWAEGCIGKGIRRPRGLVLWSLDSGLGKTEWARSLGRHIYWCGRKDLKIWDKDADYIIMDDFDWKFVPDKKQFFGAQNNFAFTDKYAGTKTVEWGKPLIFLSNYNPQLEEGWNRWYDQRMLVVNIINKLY
jgi:hypothetical protein